ncbi:hypothetical protein BU26DRAFT_520793 [Trematosphaeria pertusa]|uniref:Uncharacterized protein n=1 Tax=Trematosphaeria pertusa TaxID=390896 RepID=A0A6A6IBU4_9PLEO|nr:uncharacterized protein BU26DRAFT_520793 [Trematosphaeria pertusa]KAF2247719.1 hypothetical protein BU26DRAFT_520793 [Trematosphaeria pertusa]
MDRLSVFARLVRHFKSLAANVMIDLLQEDYLAKPLWFERLALQNMELQLAMRGLVHVPAANPGSQPPGGHAAPNEAPPTISTKRAAVQAPDPGPKRRRRGDNTGAGATSQEAIDLTSPRKVRPSAASVPVEEHAKTGTAEKENAIEANKGEIPGNITDGSKAAHPGENGQESGEQAAGSAAAESLVDKDTMDVDV